MQILLRGADSCFANVPATDASCVMRATDAGTIADGTATIEQVGWGLFHLMLEVASGRKKTWAEQWKLHNALVLFNPAPVT